MKIRHSTKSAAVLAALVLVSVTVAMGTLVYAWHTRRIVDRIVFTNADEMAAAAALHIDLQRQRGYTGLFLLSQGDPHWLDLLDRVEPAFWWDLERIEADVESGTERQILGSIRSAFEAYDAVRDRVIGLQREGRSGEALSLYLGELQTLYDNTVRLTDEIVAVNQADIFSAYQQSNREVQRLGYFVIGSICVIGGLGIGLLWLLFSRVFEPIQRLAREARELTSRAEEADDEVEQLGDSLRMLMSEVAEARSQTVGNSHEIARKERLAAIGNTVAHVAHELKNRVIAIGLLARSVEKRMAGDDPGAPRMQAIQSEVAKLEVLLKDMMDYSRPVRVSLKPVCLNGMLVPVLARLRDQAPPGVVLDYHLQDTNPTVHLDCDRMEQVLINLVRNAFEAMESGGTVRIATEAGPEGVSIRVEDNGPGIPPHIQERIFEPFFTTKKTGNGLGLAICHQIVIEHGGTLGFETSPTEGTRFAIHLPEGDPGTRGPQSVPRTIGSPASPRP